MLKLKEFLKSTLVGGLLVVLPLGLLVFIMVWIFGLVRKLIAPLTGTIVDLIGSLGGPLSASEKLRDYTADVVVIAVLIIACFFLGLFVRTRFGRWLYLLVESNILLKAPGYSLIKETVAQFIGNKKSPFSSVALVQIFGNETMVSAFITDEHPDGSFTVFVPTGPNPTSGNMYHVPARWVHPVNVPVEDTMRSIISCGAGSSKLLASRIEEGAAKPLDTGAAAPPQNAQPSEDE